MLSAIAIDDEPLALEVIHSHVAEVPYINLKASFTDAFNAIEFLQNQAVDLLFLDIKMPDISGFDLLSSLNKKPMVIFTTAYAEHAFEGFEFDAVDYLLKPIGLQRFVKACIKAADKYQIRTGLAKHGDSIFVKIGYEQVKVNFEDIYYLEAMGNYVCFVLKTGAIQPRMTISEATAILPPDFFIRVHRSFIVAYDKIDKIEIHQLHVNGHIIPVSKPYAINING